MSLKNSTKTKENTYEVEVSVDAETFAKAVNKAYKKQVKNINVPGFRKGKALSTSSLKAVLPNSNLISIIDNAFCCFASSSEKREKLT